MKKSICVIFTRLALCLLSLCMVSFANAQSTAEFCWKDSYGRGVGTIPTACNAGQTYDAGLCYDNCRSGYTGVGPVCWSGCPEGYIDMGAVCHINKPLTKDVTWECTAWWPGWLGGGCRWKDSRCPSDYTNVGLFCALTSAGKSAPPGFSGTFLDPMKNSYGRGVGKIPTNCGQKEYDAGLCYDRCRPGYSGVGPVCWGQPPANWVQCGMGAAKSSAVCGQVVFGQVASVGNLALTVATLGGSTAATSAASAANAGKLAELRAKYNQMKELYNKAKPAIDAAKKTYTTVSVSQEVLAMETPTPEDMVRVAAQIASLVDSTGASATVAAYTYAKCSAIVAQGPGGVTPPPSTPATPAPPAQGGALRWVAGPGVPGNAVIGGQEPGRQLPVCRGAYQNGVHPGKVVAGRCNIGWGGREITLTSFEVLTNAGANIGWVGGPGVPGNAVIGGQEPGRQLPVCRTAYANGVHPGKVVAGRCNIGYGGREVAQPGFEVMVTR